MALRDLFKSKKERIEKAKKDRRRAVRRVERAVDDVKREIKSLKKERDSAWDEALRYRADGQNVASRRSLTTVRAIEVMMAKLDAKAWFYSQVLRKLKLSEIDQRVTTELEGLNAAISIDPDRVANAIDQIEDELGEQEDVDKVINDAYARELGEAEAKMDEVVPSIEEMERILDGEVVEKIKRPGVLKATEGGETEPSVKQQIGEGRRRLKNLLEEDK